MSSVSDGRAWRGGRLARGVAALAAFFLAGSAFADVALERALAAIEDLQFAPARALIAEHTAARPDDVGWRHAQVLLAAMDPATELGPLVESLVARRAAIDPGSSAAHALGHALHLAWSLPRGYPTPWTTEPPLERTLAPPPDGWEAQATRAADRPDASVWELLLAARLAASSSVAQVGYLRRARDGFPEALEALAAALVVNLDGQAEVLRERLERLAERGGPRAGGCLLAAARGLVARPAERAQILERVRLYGDQGYGDEASLELLAMGRTSSAERVAELERLTLRGCVSASARIALALVATRLERGELELAVVAARRFEDVGAAVLGSIDARTGDLFLRHGHEAAAYEWLSHAFARDPTSLSARELEAFAAAAGAVGRHEEAAHAYELAAARGGAAYAGAALSALLARALASPRVFVGAGVAYLVASLAVPLAIVALVRRSRRRGRSLSWGAAIALAVVAIELALPVELRVATGAQAWGVFVGAGAVAWAGVVLSRETGFAPGRELRAVAKRLRGRPVPWVGYVARLGGAVVLMVVASEALAWWLVPVVSPVALGMARLAPGGDAAALLDPAAAPGMALLVALRAACREEILCRLFYLPLIAGRGRRGPAVVAIAVVWAVAHVGMADPEAYKLLQVFACGLILGALASRQGAASALLAHVGFNAIAIARAVA